MFRTREENTAERISGAATGQVEDLLVTQYQVPRPNAQADIQLYRQRLASHGVIDLLYHSEPKDIANAIHGQGFRQPPLR